MKSLLINLDRSPDRLERMSERFGTLGLAFERIPAVDGQALSEAEIEKTRRPAEGRPLLSRGEVACFLSHRACWRHVAEQKAPVAIFEDDVELSSAAPALLANLSWLPAGADIVKLETVRQKIWLGRTERAIGNGFALGPLRSGHWGSAAYVVTPHAAARLIELTETFADPVDHTLFNPDCGVAGRFAIEQLVPGIAIQTALLYDAASGRRDQSVIAASHKGQRSFGTRRKGSRIAREIARIGMHFANRRTVVPFRA